jgi:hypothetical protein
MNGPKKRGPVRGCLHDDHACAQQDGTSHGSNGTHHANAAIRGSVRRDIGALAAARGLEDDGDDGFCGHHGRAGVGGAELHRCVGGAVEAEEVQVRVVGGPVDPDAPLGDGDGCVELLDQRAFLPAWCL